MIPRPLALLTVATLIAAGPAAGQPMPANVSLLAIRADERERDGREKLPLIVRALQLGPGSVAGDLGTGYGYYASRFSKIVGPTGRVFAEEIDAPLLAKVRARMQADRRRNVTLVLGTVDDPKFPNSALDAVIIADVYHEIPRPGTVLSHLREALKPGGRVIVVDYLKPEMRGRARKDQTSDHNISPDFVEKDLTAAGFSLIERRDPYCTGYDGIPTYFVVARKR